MDLYKQHLTNICHAQQWAKRHLKSEPTKQEYNALSVSSVKFKRQKYRKLAENQANEANTI